VSGWRKVTWQSAVSCLAVCGLSAAAAAGTFDIKGVEISSGETEVAWGAAWQSRFPANADPLRQSYEASVGYGFTSRFKAGVKLGFEQPDGERLEATYAGVEAQALLLDPSKGPFGLAWFTGLDFGLQDGVSDVLTFGPLVSFELRKDLAVTLNPLFQRSWDPSSPGLDFAYAWQIKRTLDDTVALGVEGYGVVPDLASAPSIDFQEHRLGPVLFLSHEMAAGSGGRSMKVGAAGGGEGKDAGKVELQLGLLWGLTEATADLTGRAKLAITW
jgi:hypothetical protein